MTIPRITYEQFLQAKMVTAPSQGFEVQTDEINPLLEPHQRDLVWWGARKGRAAFFAAFGLGKTIIQCELLRLIQQREGGRGLAVLPLGVRQEFMRDGLLDSAEFRARAAELGLDHAEIVRRYGVRFKFIQSDSEIDGEHDFYLTNYESVREGKVNPALFNVIAATLDEAAILADRGNKTFGEFVFSIFPNVKYRFVATATPDPNEYQELLSYAAFLGVGDISQLRTRFFKRNSTKANNLTLRPNKEREFWLWVSSWAMFIQSPADLGHRADRYILPALNIHWHEVPSDHRQAGHEKSGQGRLLKDASLNSANSAPEKRATIALRMQKLMELRALDPDAHRIIWHDLEDERRALEHAIPGLAVVKGFRGKEDLARREQTIIDFSNGLIQELAPKSCIAGAGCNFQRHCHWAIFFSIDFNFRDFIQAVHRIYRFLQKHDVRIDMIYSEAERPMRAKLERCWEAYKVQVEKMAEIIREYGLATNALQQEMGRTMGVERVEVKGERFTLANNDAVLEYRDHVESDSSGLILTSLPFGNQYEYSLNYADFGHTEDIEHFWAQMDYLTPELLRVLKPGRDCMIHCKDRIVDGAMTGLGFQTVYSFLADCIKHFQKHGFALLGHVTIVTDVVRENASTYRLGYSEQCKDGTRMGWGLPEYVIGFRKPPSNRANGYADEPVKKDKPRCTDPEGTVVPFDRNLPILLNDGYSRSKWQLDAHGFARSDGNRLLSTEEMRRLSWGEIYRLFRSHSISHVYSYGEHVALSETLEQAGRLPVDFQLLPPQSWHPSVWTDVMRARTLNGAQSAKGKEKHLCPLQLDIVDRIIVQRSEPGDIVDDPFHGIGTVPSRAVALGRRARGSELSSPYFQDSVFYTQTAEAQASAPTLFDLLEVEGTPVMEELPA